MRNRIAHGYFDLRLDTIWDTASTLLPELISIVKPIFDELAASHPVERRPEDDAAVEDAGRTTK